MSKSFGKRMAKEVYRLTRWGGRESHDEGEALIGLVNAPREFGLGRECGLSLRMPTVWCLEDCKESHFDFKLQRTLYTRSAFCRNPGNGGK